MIHLLCQLMMEEELAMTLKELYPMLRDLDRTEKLQAIQFLAEELSKAEGNMSLPAGEYPVWSPLGAFDAARIMQDMLEADKKATHG